MATQPIGDLAVKHAFNLDGVAVVSEEDAVVLGAEPNERRCDAFEMFGRAVAG